MNKDKHNRISTKKVPNWALWLLFIICVALGFFFAGCKKDVKNASGSEIPEIATAKPEIRDVIITSTYPASIESSDKAEVVGRVNGLIKAKHFKEGDFVKAGQSLYTIESTIYDAGLREAEAQLASANAQLKYATHHYKALELAYKTNAVSEMEVSQALSQMQAASATVMQTQSQVNTARTKAGYCRVVAPISGRITSSTLDVGNYVNGEGAPVTLATIYNNDKMTVSLSIPEQIYAQISADGEGFKKEMYREVKLLLTNDESRANDVPQYIININYESPEVDSSTGNIILKGNIRGVDEKLRPGMYGIVKLPLNNVANGILVRDASISTDQRGKYLYTINAKNEVVYTPIQVGELYNDSLRVIKSGLKPDTQYVRDAMMNVRSGERVKPVLK